MNTITMNTFINMPLSQTHKTPIFSSAHYILHMLEWLHNIRLIYWRLLR
jgi:hypothetical protein